MEYNSTTDILIIPEYGRNVQKLINHAKTIEDKVERQRFVEQIVKLMKQMNPISGSLIEANQKFWSHVFTIADYDLDVDAPEGAITTREAATAKPPKLEYPERSSTFRHYGINVKKMIDVALAMKDAEKKDMYIRVIGSYMKLAYKNWNREHYVSDEIIKEDLRVMTDGAINLDAKTHLDMLLNSQPKPQQNNNNRRSSRGKSNNRKGGGRNNNYKRRR